MFVFLSKLLPLWVYPIGLVTLLLILTLFLRKRERLRTALIGLCLGLIMISGNRFVAFSLARSLEWQYFPPDEVPQAEVLVVLGGGTHGADYPRPSVEINGAGDRVLYAMRLYQQGKAEKILVSGGYIDWINDNPVSPAEDMTELMTTFGIPGEDIIQQGESMNTYEDALYCAEILREMGIERILLVTSALHMPRSVALFEEQGLEVVPLPADYTVTERAWNGIIRPSPQQFLINLAPTANHIAMTSTAIKEYLGFLMYRLQGWL